MYAHHFFCQGILFCERSELSNNQRKITIYIPVKKVTLFYRRGLIFARGGSFFLRRSGRKTTVTKSKYKTSKVKNALFAGTYVILFTSSTFSEVRKNRKSPVTRQPLVLRIFKATFSPKGLQNAILRLYGSWNLEFRTMFFQNYFFYR